MSALLSGLQVLGWVLHDFVEKGGRVLNAEDGSDAQVDLEFGPLFRKNETPPE